MRRAGAVYLKVLLPCPYVVPSSGVISQQLGGRDSLLPVFKEVKVDMLPVKAFSLRAHHILERLQVSDRRQCRTLPLAAPAGEQEYDQVSEIGPGNTFDFHDPSHVLMGLA